VCACVRNFISAERVDETRRSRGHPENLDFDRRVEGLEFGLMEFEGEEGSD
jgi:hypothetical protein